MLTDRKIQILECIILIAIAFFPILFNYPYRVNIFLSWEGAYRLYLGQLPYKDFGIPMGYAYWIIPAIFFKIFGPFLYTLIKAQVFINLISGFSFRHIIKELEVKAPIRLIAIVVFSLSYTLFNFWPWYNHSVIVIQLLSFAFLISAFKSERLKQIILIFFASFFMFYSFFIKQDGGALGFMISMGLVLYYTVFYRNLKLLILYTGFFIATAIVFIFPFLNHDFLYWFNYGQDPHYSRVNVIDIVNAFFYGSQWIKFYSIVIFVILIIDIRNSGGIKLFMNKFNDILFYLLMIGILIEVSIFQVTSYTPPNNNVFFHSFATAFILYKIKIPLSLHRMKVLFSAIFLVLIWWSGTYYKYIDRILLKFIPKINEQPENVISKNTYVINKIDTSYVNIPMSEWTLNTFMVFKNIKMPKPTIDGIKKLNDLIDKDDKVLNMTELTPLAYELNFKLFTNQPLWYHKNVSIFDKEIANLKMKINSYQYDVVLFEVIPYLNNFYPEELRNELKDKYILNFSFIAPRRPTDATIEVYLKPNIKSLD